MRMRMYGVHNATLSTPNQFSSAFARKHPPQNLDVRDEKAGVPPFGLGVKQGLSLATRLFPF